MYIGIETFLTVIRAQSLSKAAAELHVAQTTVSQRLIVLERELGMTLIERGKGIKHIRLTTAGEEFSKLAEQWSYICREIQVLQVQGPRFSLVVASVDSLNFFALPQVYNALSQHCPKMKLKIRTSHSDEIYKLVETRQVDVGFTLQEQVHSNVTSKKCYMAPMVVLQPVTSSTTKSKFKSIHPKDLDPNYELFMPWGQGFEIWHDRWWDPLSPTGIKLDSAHLLINLLRDPLQWAIVPKWVATIALKQGNYSIYSLTESPPEYTCYKITHKHPTNCQRQALDIFEYHFQSSISESNGSSSNS